MVIRSVGARCRHMRLAAGAQTLVANFLLLCFPGWYASTLRAETPAQLFNQYCFDCHQGDSAASELDLAELLDDGSFNATLLFENIATEQMPPSDADLPSPAERGAMLAWLASQQPKPKSKAFGRISRHEFIHSVNDLLGIQLDLVAEIPEDRGTHKFDSDHRIQLSREVLGSYFKLADQMLEHALPAEGFVNEQTWVTNRLKDSHETYNIYVRDYDEGLLFSWTRANNGDSYSFFFDNFDPRVAGWYELAFDVSKVGEIQGDVSIQVHAGKYFYADDRPQPQRLLGVISVGNAELETRKIRAFLRPGDNVSVHCFSKENFREQNPQRGAYIRQMEARGPLQDAWPPNRYAMLFDDLPRNTPGDSLLDQEKRDHHDQSPEPTSSYLSRLERIGGSVTVSSFQPGMDKEKILDGSNKTFWHTRFEPTLAAPPHFIVFQNPNRYLIEGLSYSTWSGGNGNGQVEGFVIHTSEDGENWGDPLVIGDLQREITDEQLIKFPVPTDARFIKFAVTKAVSIDGRSLASVGKLDVITSLRDHRARTKVSIASTRAEDLRRVVKRFAERAFASELADSELQPYFGVAVRALRRDGDFIEAAKVGFKAVLCSHRFLMTPGEHSSEKLFQDATLARVLWLSVPDEGLIAITASLSDKIAKMLADSRSDRMIQSLCNQWLNLRSWNSVPPSLKLYPGYDDLLEHYLPRETISYLAYLIRENRPVGELIDSNYSFLNQRLADHYGIEGVVGQQLRRVSFSSEHPRGGLLTMGSVLKVTTDGFQTSPILRGAWISKNIVGTPISPPPEAVKAIEPENSEGSASLREQIELHKNNESCFGCHKSIDPFGFALENFDATGQWRTSYRKKIPHKQTFQYRPEGYFELAAEVDASGEVGGHEFTDIYELKRLLRSQERKIAYNFAKMFFEYASGCEPTLKERVALLRMATEQKHMRDLVIDVLAYAVKN